MSGRRRVAGWPPRWLTKTTPAERRNGDGDVVAEFVETYCRITKDSIAGPVGELVVVRPWQRELLRAIYARDRSGLRRHRTALVGMPRKNGKSSLAAGLALFELFVGPAGGEVYSCAADKEQAKIVFGTAKRMVELDPELEARANVFRDVIELPETGSIYRALSSEAFTKEGLNPSATIFDELHAQPNRELWDVMQLAQGSRLEPLTLAITTAGRMTDSLGRDTICLETYAYGKAVAAGEIDDPTFFLAWWEPAAGAEADHRDPKIWLEANPGYDDLVAAKDFESAVLRTPENEFRTKRTNVFTAGTDSALPFGTWDAITVDDGGIGEVSVAEPVVLMVDGSWSGDATGIIGVTLADRDDDGEVLVGEHVFVVDCWERPADAPPEWRVPVADVKARIRQVARELSVVEIGLDPFRWQATISELRDEGLPIAEFPTTSVPRMVAAWKTFYDAVLDREITADNDPRLARHVAAMVLKVDQLGARPVKASKASKRHIDLGICAVAGLTIARQTDAGPVDLAAQVQ